MGLDKAIEHGKEHRKQYRDLRFYHRNFRNHGGSYWDDNRRHKFWVKEVRSMQDLKEYFARRDCQTCRTEVVDEKHRSNLMR